MNATDEPVSYRVEIADANAHLFRVTLEVAHPALEVNLSLPVWIPGSYMVREFARHVAAIEATQAGVRRAVEPLDKTQLARALRCRCRCAGSCAIRSMPSTARCARPISMRGAASSTAPACCCASPVRRAAPQRVTIGALPRGWSTATAMPSAGRGVYEAADYDELVDHPFKLRYVLARYVRGAWRAA